MNRESAKENHVSFTLCKTKETPSQNNVIPQLELPDLFVGEGVYTLGHHPETVAANSTVLQSEQDMVY